MQQYTSGHTCHFGDQAGCHKEPIWVFFPKNYGTVAHWDWNSSRGGVLIATKKGVVTDEVPLKASAGGETICTCIACTKSNPLYVCAYYSTPWWVNGLFWGAYKNLWKNWQTWHATTKSTVILAGDYNDHAIDWDDLVLDLVCTNKPSFFKTIDTIPRMTLKAQINKKPQRRVCVWSKADWNLMKMETTAFCDDFIKTGEDRSVESDWELLASHLKEMQHNQIPSELPSTCYNIPWLTTKLKWMCRKKHRLFRRTTKLTNPIHKAAYEHIQNETCNALRKANWSYVNGILSEGLEQDDMKAFYGYIRSQHQDNQGVSPLRKTRSTPLRHSLQGSYTERTVHVSIYQRRYAILSQKSSWSSTPACRATHHQWGRITETYGKPQDGMKYQRASSEP